MAALAAIACSATIVTGHWAQATAAEPDLVAETVDAYPDHCPRPGPTRAVGHFKAPDTDATAWFQYGPDANDHGITQPVRKTPTRRLNRRAGTVTACIVGVRYEQPLVFRLIVSDHGKIAKGRVMQDSHHDAGHGPPKEP